MYTSSDPSVDCLYLLRHMFDSLPEFQTSTYGTDQGPWLTAEGERRLYAAYGECRPSDAVLAMDHFVTLHPEWVDHYPGGAQILNQSGLIEFARAYPDLAADPTLTTRLPVHRSKVEAIFGNMTPLAQDDQWSVSAAGMLLMLGIVGVLAYDYGKKRRR